jgi:hypothetical protein
LLLVGQLVPAVCCTPTVDVTELSCSQIGRALFVRLKKQTKSLYSERWGCFGHTRQLTDYLIVCLDCPDEAQHIYQLNGCPDRRQVDSQEQHLLVNLLSVYTQTRELALKGAPDDDWRAICRLLQDGACTRLKDVAEEVRNVRLLDRGTHLRQALAQDCRDNGDYRNPLAITRQAFVQEHFSTTTKPESGVVVMNMHKAKGKQFDEVIIFEGGRRKAPVSRPTTQTGLCAPTRKTKSTTRHVRRSA